jgi:hypothetical protein
MKSMSGHQFNSQFKIQHIHILHGYFFIIIINSRVQVVNVDLNLAHP